KHAKHLEPALNGAKLPAPVRLRLQRVDRAFVKRPRDGCRVHLPPAVRIEQRRVEILQTQRRRKQQYQKQREVLAHFLNRRIVLVVVGLPSKSLSQRYHFESRYTLVTQS